MNMRKLFLLIFSITFVAIAGAQTIASQADSLLKRLQITNYYDDKIELLGKISDVYSYSDSAKALYYALQIKKLAEDKRDECGIGIAHYRLGGVYLEFNLFDQAEKNYIQAEKILEKDTSRRAQGMLARTWSNHGILYQRKGNIDRHLQYLLEKTIPINERLKDSVNLGKNYHNIGIVFQNIKEYKKAIDYFQKSLPMLRHAEWVPELKDNYTRIAESMLYTNVQDSLRDSTFHLLKRAEVLIKRYPDAISEILYLEAMGMATEYFDGHLNVADNYYAKAIDLAEQNNVVIYKTALLSRQYYIKEKQGNYKGALAISQKLYTDYKEFITPKDKLLQLKHMMEMQEKLGNIKLSLSLHQQFIQLNDSIQADIVSVKVQELEQKYEAKEKETQIIKLNQLAQEQQLQIQKNRQWMYLLATAILFLIGFFFARQIINRNKHKIAVQEAELLQQRLEKMKQEQYIGHFAAVLEGQEQERTRLAIDLHDGLGGSLSGIRLKLSKIIQDSEIQAPAQHRSDALKKTAYELDKSINDLRHIARNMMPESLLKYGLTAAIKDFCKSMESENVEITFQSYDVQDDFPQSMQIMIFRILQELITNAVKHAGARHILAQCLQQQNIFSITVEDDGRGFDIATDFEGIGLNTLKNRVNFLQGKLDIQSEQGVGTTINIEFSIKDEQQN
jgi:two-component system, NarL family, sensor kinase